MEYSVPKIIVIYVMLFCIYIMLRSIMLCYVMLIYAMLCCVFMLCMLCYAVMLCYVMLCYVMLCYIYKLFDLKLVIGCFYGDFIVYYTSHDLGMNICCSNGVGMSAVFAAVALGIESFDEKKAVDVYSIAVGLRKERAGAIQHFYQYKFIYQVYLRCKFTFRDKSL